MVVRKVEKAMSIFGFTSVAVFFIAAVIPIRPSRERTSICASTPGLSYCAFAVYTMGWKSSRRSEYFVFRASPIIS